jgi:hypothetical protein
MREALFERRTVPDACQVVRGTTGNGGEHAADQSDRASSSVAGQPANLPSKPQASQAESASSILVTRSMMMKPQVSGLGFAHCLVRSAGGVPHTLFP